MCKRILCVMLSLFVLFQTAVFAQGAEQDTRVSLNFSIIDISSDGQVLAEIGGDAENNGDTAAYIC